MAHDPVAIVGGGAWGTALAQAAAGAGRHVVGKTRSRQHGDRRRRPKLRHEVAEKKPGAALDALGADDESGALRQGRRQGF